MMTLNTLTESPKTRQDSGDGFRLTSWKEKLKYDPIPSLKFSRNLALRFFAARDLEEDKSTGPVEQLWELPKVKKIVEKQERNGSWRYHGGRKEIRSAEDYDQIETFRILRILVEKYGLNRENPAIERAAAFLFSHQSNEGDIRGIIGNQYAPYYSAAMMELLIKSGYSSDPRIEKGFEWLKSIRQDDGGWAFPPRTVGMKLDRKMFRSPTVAPDRTRPFSHLITGMVLRAFASHPIYKKSEVARHAGKLLASRFFKSDPYPDRRAPSFWTSFSFPFWFTDLLSSLDSLSLIGLDPNDPDIQIGLNWFVSKQRRTGMWKLLLRAMAGEEEPDAWITLAVCRVFKRFFH